MFVSFCEVRSIIKIVVTKFLMIWRVFAWKYLNQIVSHLLLHLFIARLIAQAIFFTNFESMIKAIDNEDKELHILGDLNCNMLKHIPDQPTKTLKSIYEMYQLY